MRFDIRAKPGMGMDGFFDRIYVFNYQRSWYPGPPGFRKIRSWETRWDSETFVQASWRSDIEGPWYRNWNLDHIADIKLYVGPL